MSKEQAFVSGSQEGQELGRPPQPPTEQGGEAPADGVAGLRARVVGLGQICCENALFGGGELDQDGLLVPSEMNRDTKGRSI